MHYWASITYSFLLISYPVIASLPLGERGNFLQRSCHFKGSEAVYLNGSRFFVNQQKPVIPELSKKISGIQQSFPPISGYSLILKIKSLLRVFKITLDIDFVKYLYEINA